MSFTAEVRDELARCAPEMCIRDSPDTISAEHADRVPDIVIITGMSGSGRTQAMHVFEDLSLIHISACAPA